MTKSRSRPVAGIGEAPGEDPEPAGLRNQRSDYGNATGIGASDPHPGTLSRNAGRARRVVPLGVAEGHGGRLRGDVSSAGYGHSVSAS